MCEDRMNEANETSSNHEQEDQEVYKNALTITKL